MTQPPPSNDNGPELPLISDKHLILRRPIHQYEAVMEDLDTARCGSITGTGESPMAGLCTAMVEAGLPDGAMQVRYQDGSPYCFIGSIHQTAAYVASGTDEASQLDMVFA